MSKSVKIEITYPEGNRTTLEGYEDELEESITALRQQCFGASYYITPEQREAEMAREDEELSQHRVKLTYGQWKLLEMLRK